MRSVVLYIVLVGVPLLGILGILQVGQSLTPPISLSGIIEGQIITADTASTIAIHANTNQSRVPDQLQGYFFSLPADRVRLSRL
jgi:hypothetical protein